MNTSISINVRSQLSSLGKNFDTLYERTFAEALNLHLRTNKLVMGEVYMIPLVAYDPDKMARKKVGWKEKAPIKYIPAFRELTKRESVDVDEYPKPYEAMQMSDNPDNFEPEGKAEGFNLNDVKQELVECAKKSDFTQ